jgi:outer membrane protein assembly factor BamB
MPRARLDLIIVTACLAACGPASPGQTDATTEAPGESTTDLPDPTTTAPDPTTTGETDTTADPPDTVGTTTPTEPTTAEPPPCPEGQPLTPLWDATFVPLDDFNIHVADGPVVTLADGRIVAAVSLRGPDGQFAPGLLFVDALGSSQGITPGSLHPQQGVVFDLAVDPAAGDELLLTGKRLGDDVDSAFLARFNASGDLQGELPLPPGLANRAALALTPDAFVLAGDADLPLDGTIAALDRASGDPLWDLELTGVDDLVVRDITADPDGGFVVIGDGDLDVDAGNTTVVAVRVTGDGAITWTRNLALLTPVDAATAVTTTAAGHAVLLTSTWDADPATGGVTAIALDLATGETAWETAVAGNDAVLGQTWATTILADADGLTIPVAHSPEVNQQAPSSAVAIVVHRLSLAGEPLDLPHPPIPAPDTATADIAAARGACGELVLMAPLDGAVWLATRLHE